MLRLSRMVALFDSFILRTLLVDLRLAWGNGGWRYMIWEK